LLTKWLADLNSVSSVEARNNLDAVQTFLGRGALVLNSLSPTVNISQTTIDKYRSDISTARANVDTAIANIASAVEKLSIAQSSLSLAREELKLKQAGTVSGQISIQEAEVARAEASVENVKAKIAKARIIAPISGVVTKQDTRAGEIVAQNVSIISLISASKFQIEANVPEADIAKIVRGQRARVTLDAYGPDADFEANVVSIDPAETVIDGVPTYKTTLQFSKDDKRVKSGMTANVDIEGESRLGVLAIPQRAVISKDGEKTTRVLNADLTEAEIKIVTGLRGSDGFIEILSGLKEGDRVITATLGK
jgi:RND family efflux transporter MFP subunit